MEVPKISMRARERAHHSLHVETRGQIFLEEILTFHLLGSGPSSFCLWTSPVPLSQQLPVDSPVSAASASFTLGELGVQMCATTSSLFDEFWNSDPGPRACLASAFAPWAFSPALELEAF